jgi:hypothetical protein
VDLDSSARMTVEVGGTAGASFPFDHDPRMHTQNSSKETPVKLATF